MSLNNSIEKLNKNKQIFQYKKNIFFYLKMY